MSFVHCPSCSRAYDLRRGASCPRCVASLAPREQAAGPPPREQAAGPSPREHPPGGLAAGAPRAPAPAATDELPLEERIVAMVAELARVVEQASSAELVAAQRLLAERKLPGLGAGRLLGLPERAAEAVAHGLGKVSAQVTRVIERPRQSATRLLRGLRSVLGAL